MKFCDASKSGLASVCKENCTKLNICRKQLNFIKEAKRSTWRELEAIRYSLDSVKNLLRKKHIKRYPKNYGSRIVAKSGSNKSFKR